MNTTANGSYTNQNKLSPSGMLQDITNAPSGRQYVATMGVDMPFAYQLISGNRTCSLVSNNSYSQAINQCAQGQWNGACCLNTTDWEGYSAALPSLLADMCHSLVLPTSILGIEQQCVAVVYHHADKIAFFKAAPAAQPAMSMNMPGLGSTCNAPNSTVLWQQANGYMASHGGACG